MFQIFVKTCVHVACCRRHQHRNINAAIARSHCNERFIERILTFDFLLYDERIVKMHRRVATEVAANFFLRWRQLLDFHLFRFYRVLAPVSADGARTAQDHLAQLYRLCVQHPCFASLPFTSIAPPAHMLPAAPDASAMRLTSRAPDSALPAAHRALSQTTRQG
jgi:hypothetical protein